MKKLLTNLFKGEKKFAVKHVSEKGTVVTTYLKAKNEEEAVKLANASSPETLTFVEVSIEE